METKLGRERRVDEGICGAVRVKAHLHLTHSREGTRRQVAYLQCPWRPRPLECRMRQSRHCKDTETWGMIFFFFFFLPPFLCITFLALHLRTTQPPHLPTSRRGLGPKRSMRIPRGSVVALSRKEPMVKPRLSIFSCWSQLVH